MLPLLKEKWCSSKITSRHTPNLNSPYSVVTSFSNILSTVDSFESLKSIRSAIVPIFRSNLSANVIKSSLLAMLPSSFIISQITPAGVKPASDDKSHAASV